MKVFKIILAIIVVYFMVFAVGALIGEIISDKPTVQTNYKQAAYKPFMKYCTAEGATKKDCQCVYDYLDRNTTDTEFRKLDENSKENPDYFPPVLLNAIDNCL
jgi:capsule polysaccharide export protein KpsE/RkpR